jgi:hypothetical protein
MDYSKEEQALPQLGDGNADSSVPCEPEEGERYKVSDGFPIREPSSVGVVICHSWQL